MQFGEFPTMAPTMLQPVGGMGRIGQAFGHELREVITYQAVVTKLRRTDTGVRVTWTYGGGEHQTDAPLVVVAVRSRPLAPSMRTFPRQ